MAADTDPKVTIDLRELACETIYKQHKPVIEDFVEKCGRCNKVIRYLYATTYVSYNVSYGISTSNINPTITLKGGLYS